MKKLSLLLCPVALMALGTSAHAGTYLPIAPNNGDLDTFYESPTLVGAVSAHAPRLNPDNPTGPKLIWDYPTGGSNQSGLSRKSWVWDTDDPINDPAPSEGRRCSYTIACNPSADAALDAPDARGGANFAIYFGNVVDTELHYFQQLRYGHESSNFLPPTPTGQPNTAWTQYGDTRNNRIYPYVGRGGDSYVRAEASTTVSTSAGVLSQDEPSYGNASSGQASIQIRDFDCPDQAPPPPPP